MEEKKDNFRWKPEWTEYVILVIVLRLLYAGLGWLVVSGGGPIPLNETIHDLVRPFLKTDEFSRFFVNPWFQWDTISYLGIAILGYRPDASIAFMPLYPLLIRIAAPLTGENYLLAALILSTLFCIITLILSHELFAEYYTPGTARGAVLVFITFPTAFFLLAGYTESLFLALVLAFWLSARRKRWLLASFFAALATLTRLQGVVLSAVVLWMMMVSLMDQPPADLFGQIKQIPGVFRNFREKFFVKMDKTIWLAVVSPVLVSAGYQAWLHGAGYGTIPEALRQYWKLETVMPWEGFFLFLRRIPNAHFSYMDWIDLILFIVVLFASLLALRLLDPAFSLYIWLTIAILLTRGTPPHLLASYSRYFLALFPLFLLPALMKIKYLQFAIIACFAALQILLVWIFLSGSWVA